MKNTCDKPMAMAVVFGAAAWALAAQSPAPQQSVPQPVQILGTPRPVSAQAPRRPVAPTTQPAVAAAPTQPVVPAPETPQWPANEAPTPAQVQWDSHGLHINAENSSLRQILAQVATVTGAKLEGLSADERVFGEYGPGQAREVLAQLLHGSPYNVMMVGDQGQGTPREIVLSTRVNLGNTQARAGSPQQDSDDDADQEQPQEQPVQQINPPGIVRPMRQRGVPMQPPNLPPPPPQQ